MEHQPEAGRHHGVFGGGRGGDPSWPSGTMRTAVRTSWGPSTGPRCESYAVPADAPPLFVLFAKDDGIGVQATKLHKKWKDAGKPAELVAFESGGHGFGMSKRGQPTDDWIERYWKWLAALELNDH